MDVTHKYAATRKRKRKVLFMPLYTPAAFKKTPMHEKESNNMQDKKWMVDRLNARKTRQLADVELICPIRVDVELNGLRFQDTFLVDAYVCLHSHVICLLL